MRGFRLWHLHLLDDPPARVPSGNVAHGAKIGANHTGRLPDQEAVVGEGVGSRNRRHIGI